MLFNKKAVQDVPAGATAPRAASPAAAGIAEATLPVAVHGLRRVTAAAHGRSVLAAHILRPVAVARRNQPAVALLRRVGVRRRLWRISCAGLRVRCVSIQRLWRHVAFGERQHRSAVVQTVRTIPARGGGGG